MRKSARKFLPPAVNREIFQLLHAALSKILQEVKANLFGDEVVIPPYNRAKQN